MNLRSSIFGDIGSAKQVQREFLKLFECAIIQNDLSKSVERFQFSIQEAKVKLNLAISPGCWLIASDMILNTESKISYNNFLQKASHSMHLGLNSDVNNQTKVTGIRHNLGASKISFQLSIGTIKEQQQKKKHLSLQLFQCFKQKRQINQK